MTNEKDKTKCTLHELLIGSQVYAVNTRPPGESVYPLAIFQCRHCAEEYADSHLFYSRPFVHELPMGIYTQFFRNGVQEIVEVPGV